MSTILLRNLTRTQEHILIFLGVMHWLLGGLVCWACEGIQAAPPQRPHIDTTPERREEEHEWHPASDFRIPGTAHPILPRSREQEIREGLDFYLLQRRKQLPRP